MKAVRPYLITLLSFIFLLLIAFLVLDYFDLFMPDRFDLPNKYVRKNSPLVVAGANSVLKVLEDIAYKNVIAKSSDSNSEDDYYKNLAEIGSSTNPKITLIKKIEPDIYLSDLNLKNKIDFLFEKNNSAYSLNHIERQYFDFSTYENCLSSIAEIGALTNNEKAAMQVIQTIEAKILELRRKNYGRPSPSVLVLLHTKVGTFVGTKNSFVGSILNALNIKTIPDSVRYSDKPYELINLKSRFTEKADLLIVLFDDDFYDSFTGDYKSYNAWKNNAALLIRELNLLQKKRKCPVYSFERSKIEGCISLKLSTVAEKLADIVYIEK